MDVIRLLPLVLGPHDPEGNSYRGLFTSFVQLVEKLGSLLFTCTELILIAEHIQLFFSMSIQLFDGVKIKTKAQFVFHYPHMIERFGRW